MKNINDWKSWLLFVIALLFTLFAAFFVKFQIDKKDEAKFRFECKEISSKIDLRLHAHAQLLRSGTAFFDASDSITREDWHNFISQSKVNLNLPGILGTGFSMAIPKDKLPQHTRKIRNEGFLDYKVWPEHSQETYTSIVFLEPFSGSNLRAFGYDMMTEPVRREAMERARDMNIVALSGKVLLVQETETDVQAGNLMYVPVYKKRAILNTVEQRRAAIKGWVYSPYRMNDLMLGILENWELSDNDRTFYLHIFDGANCSSQSLLFESHSAEEQKNSERIRFSLKVPIDFNGHLWILEYTQRKENMIIDYLTAWLVFSGGILISILLLFLSRSLIGTRYRAIKIAETLTSELKESELLLRESNEIASLGTYELDLRTGIWKSSEILDAIFGIDANYKRSVEGWTLLLHPDYREPMTDYLNNWVIKEGQAFDKQYKVIRYKDKEERWVHGQGKLELDNNNPIKLIGTIQDITEQKRAEESLQLSREQYRSIFENSPLGIYRSTPDGEILTANKALLQMLEFESLAELQNRDLETEGYSKESTINRKQFVEMIERDGYVKGLEESWTTKNGRVIPIRENARIVKGINGKIFFEGTVEDISERKKTEKQLLLSQEQYTIAIEGSNDGIWDWDIISNEVYFSPRWKGILGYEEDELANSFSTWEELLHPEDQKRALSVIQAYFDNEIPEYEVEFRMKHKDGSFRWILARGKALRYENGKPYRMAGSHTDITFRKLSEEEIIRLSNKNQLILDSVGEGIYGLDMEGKMTFVNPSAALMIGSSVEELVGKQGHDDHHHSHLDGSVYHRENCPIYAAFYTGVTSHVDDEVFWRKDGTSFPVEYTSTPLRNDSGNLIGSVVVFKDITERKQAEKELKASEKRLRSIIEASPIPMVITKVSEGLIIMANESLGKLFKISLSNVIGQKAPDFYANPEQRNELLKRLVKEGFIDNFELILKRLDGELFWCSVSFKLMTLENEQVMISGFHDITERKKTEEEIMNHREHLEEMVSERTHKLTVSEQKLQKSLKDITDYKFALDESSLVAITDNKGIINYANDIFCKISKYSREEIIGNTHRIINSGYHSSDFFIDLWRTISKGKVWRGEVRNKAKDGSFYWVDSTIVPFLDEQGKPYQYVSVRFDITDKKLSEEDLIKARDAANSANQAKSEFLANMSHEIRTPMNAVIGFSELLAKSVTGEKQKSQIESIRSSGNNLLKIINDILDLSKIEASKIDIEPTSVNLLDLVKEVENMFAPKVMEKGIHFAVKYESEMQKMFLLDEVRLRQILFNLIGNAIKFTDEGQVFVCVCARENHQAKEKIDLIIRIEDTAMGIPADQQELIFEPFAQQTGQNSKYGGTGLGLSITKKLIEKMSGSISLESEVGKGSVFTVIIPSVSISDDEIICVENTFNYSAIQFKEAKILLVDDNVENRKLILDMLGYSQLTVFEASNGKEAVEIAIEHLPDLILMDLRMPVMNGYEATQILKSTNSTKSIPIIAISASTRKVMNGDRSKKIFDEFLMKPIDAFKLFSKMKTYLKYKITGKAVIQDTEVINIVLTEKQINKLPELIAQLENEFLPIYNNVSKSQMIDEIEEFGKDLRILAEDSKIECLLNHATDICSLADNFEIDKLLKTLDGFPKIIEQLKMNRYN